MRRSDIPAMEQQRNRKWQAAIGRARSALATATRNLAEAIGSDDPEIEVACQQALDRIEEADEALVDVVNQAGIDSLHEISD